MEILTKENLVGAKLLPLQFPGLSRPFQGKPGFLGKDLFLLPRIRWKIVRRWGRGLNCCGRCSPERNSSEISGMSISKTGEKCGEILAKFSADFRPSFSRENRCKKFHTNSFTRTSNSTGLETKFFHCDILGVGGPSELGS